MNLLDTIMAVNPSIGWAILGVVLLIAEILLTNSFFIPFSVAAFIVVALTFFKLLPMGILWQGLVFAILGVSLIPLSRKLLAKISSETPDINQY